MDVSTDLGGAGTLTLIPYKDVSTDLDGAGTLTHLPYVDVSTDLGGDPHPHNLYVTPHHQMRHKSHTKVLSKWLNKEK